MKDRFDIQEEIVCGYKVSENRKKLWVAELDMLEMLEKTCRENGIKYFFLMGSAIGVERHKGFIPWDDDIDLAMLRDDFEKFLACPKTHFPDYIDIQYGISEHGVDFLLRIRDSRTTGIIRGERALPGNKGAFIEIYVFDYVKDDFLSTYLQIWASRILCSLMSEKVSIACDKKIMHVGKRILSSWFKLETLWKWYETVCKLRKKEKCGFANFVSLPNYGKKRKCRVSLNDVSHVKYSTFEYLSVPIPIGNDKYLRQLYGDYMTLPPLDERGQHHDSVVFYDPNRSYKEYVGSSIIERYFAGDTSLELL